MGDLEAIPEWGVFDILQIPHSALEREHEERISRAAGVGGVDYYIKRDTSIFFSPLLFV